MVLVCDTLSYLCHFYSPSCITKLWVGHEQVLLNSMHKVLVRTVTLTFDLATWFFFATHRLVMINIFAISFLNPTMHNKAMGRTPTGFTEVYAQSLSAEWDFDL